MLCGADGPGAAEEVEVVDQLLPQGKAYPLFGGKAPRRAAPIVKVEPVPVESTGAGAGEQKAGDEVVQHQVHTPPLQHRALSAISVREERTRAKQQKSTCKTAGLTGALTITDNVPKNHTDLFDESSSSSSDDEDIVVKF